MIVKVVKIWDPTKGRNIIDLNIDGNYAAYDISEASSETTLYIMTDLKMKVYRLNVALPFGVEDPEGSLDRFFKLLSLN
jgi:hypothetical protein